ncbi:MAG: hypothetical protein K0S20_23 [Patescibacteria group bacterium]|jgi:glycosyltransferase involved in cell wall biosynthesis|nr:hypothetical protein [Patescibacteria group bacterium]
MADSLPLISVLIPLYNQGAYVIEAVSSVMAQDYPNVQVIVVNDGSSDDSEIRMQELVKKYHSLIYISQENAGVAKACSAALAEAKGEYVLRLDADDYIPADYLSKLHACLSVAGPKVGYAYCDAHYVGAREGISKAREYSLLHLAQENYIHVSALVRMSALKKTTYFDPALVWGLEDWDLWLSLADQGFSGVYCRDTFLNYRIKDVPSRNHIDADKYRTMRALVYKNHPKIYRNPFYVLAVQGWRLQKRWQAIRGIS